MLLYKKIFILTLITYVYITKSFSNTIFTEIEKKFNVMGNYTSPGIYKHQSIGVYTGGSIYLRNHIQQLQLLNISLPYMNAGCGGIDFYAGSFSFINKEAFTSFMKSIISNASGYAFSLAMQNICPSCTQVAETLQQKVQQLNQHLGNSCQLAKGLVTDTINAFSSHRENEASLEYPKSGLGSDFFDSFKTNKNKSIKYLKDKQDTKDKKINNNEKIDLFGNLTWRALKSKDLHYDDDILEQIMSIVGTVIVYEDKGNTSSKLLPGGLINLESLLETKSYQQYKCDLYEINQCTNVSIKIVSNSNNLENKIRELYIGSDNSVGIIDIYSNNRGALTTNQQSLLRKIGYGINGQIRNLVLLNPDAARDYVNYAIKFIVFKLIEQQIKEAFTLVRHQLNNLNNSPDIKMLQESIINNEKSYLSDLQRISNNYNQIQLLNYYNSLINRLKHN